MISMRLSTRDLSTLRFAISPVWEIVASLRVLHRPSAHPVHQRWVRRTRRELLSARPELTLLRTLATASPTQIPSFLAPEPSGVPGDLGVELDALARVDPDEVGRSVREALGERSRSGSVGALLTDPVAGLTEVVGQMRAYWALAIGSYWPRIAGVLEGDVAHRGRTLATSGPAVMFGELDEQISWSAGRLDIDKPHLPAYDHDLAGRGLVLVPSCFGWPNTFVKADEPWQPIIRYPARRVGVIWEDGATRRDVAAALGDSRARLLELLDAPMTTSELARATALAPGGISAHLDRLVRAGLVVRHRQGRVVVYLRTARGDALFD